MGGVVTALIGQLGCYVASVQPSSLQANGCCACVRLLEGSLPATFKGVNLHCMLCEQAGWHISSAVCVCAPHVSVLSSFLSLPLLPRPSLQFTDQLLSRTVGTVVPHHLAGGQAGEGG